LTISCRDARRQPVLLLRIGKRADEYRSAGLERFGRAQAGLELFGRLAQQLEFSFGRADHHAGLLDDGVGHGGDADRFRQTGGERVQTCRSCGERTIPGLARPKRQLGFLALDELQVGALFQRFRVVTCALHRFVPPHTIQCLRSARADGVDVFVIVDRKLSRRVEIDLQERDDTPLDGDRQHETGLTIAPRPRIRPFLVLGAARLGRRGHDGCEAPHRLGERRVVAELVELP
jgi:hypothetical protein